MKNGIHATNDALAETKIVSTGSDVQTTETNGLTITATRADATGGADEKRHK